MGRRWSLRRATERDVSDIQSVVNAAYEKYLVRMDRPPAPLTQDYPQAVQTGTVWVTGKPIVGLISLNPAAEGALVIENVAVLPSMQGSGIGRALMEFAEEEAARMGLDRLQLYTNEVMTENVAIYQHLGYVEIRRQVHDGYRRVFMEKHLC